MHDDTIKGLREEWKDIRDVPCVDDLNNMRSSAADEIEARDKRISELEAALKDIEIRTRTYAGAWESYPLAAGVHDLAYKVLNKRTSHGE